MSQRRNYFNVLLNSSSTSVTTADTTTNQRTLQGYESSSTSLTTEDNSGGSSNIEPKQQHESEAEAAAGSFTSHHEPLSPPSGIEQFFLPQIDSSRISAFALASEIKKEQRSPSSKSKSRNSSSRGSVASTATDDFQSACGSIPEQDLHDEQNLDGHEEHFLTPKSIYTSENTLSTFPIEETEEIILETPDEDIMTDVATTATTPVTEAPTPKEEETNDDFHLDATQHVYETAKNVWGFGKNIFFVKPFLGLTEAIATKVVGELKDVDDAVKPHIANIDNAFFNPAVNAVVSFVMPAVSKVDPVVRPLYTTVLRPFGLFREPAGPAIEPAVPVAPETEKEEEVPKAEKLVIEEKKEKKGSTAPEVTAPAPAPVGKSK